MRTYLISALLVFATLISPNRAWSESASNITIGIILSLTGQGSYWANAAKEGIILAAEEMEKDEGVKVSLIFEDSATSTSQGVKAYQKLVTVDKVDAIVGDIWGYLTVPLIPLSQQYKVLTISPSVSAHPCRDYFWGAAANIDLLNGVYGNFLSARPTLKRVSGLFFDDADWGNRIRKALHGAVANESRLMVAEELSSELNPDFRSLITRMLNKKPDIVFVAHEPSVSTKTLRERRYGGIIVQSNAIFEALLRQSSHDEDMEGVYFADVAPDESFRQRYEQRFKHRLMLEPQTSYEIIRSLVKAYKINGHHINDGIRHVSYEGVAGPIDYTSSCSPNKSNFKMFQYVNGATRIVD